MAPFLNEGDAAFQWSLKDFQETINVLMFTEVGQEVLNELQRRVQLALEGLQLTF